MNLDALNLLDGSWYADDPHAVWAWMRREAPVHYDELGDVWGITRYDDVLAIEKDPKTYSSRRAPRPHGDPLPMMISMDDPDHQRRRSLVNRGFTPRRIGELEPTVAALCRRIVDRVCESGSCDFVWDVAAPLPLLVIADLLGFEEEHHDDLLRWSDDLIRATTIDPPPEIADAGLRAMLGFRELQLGVITDRRANPRDDLISTLCAAEVDGHRLDDESIVQETLLLLIGGDETTRHVITGGMLALLEWPDQRASLAADLDQLPVAVEELLRWVSPIKNMARTVTRDLELRGQQLHEGDQVMLFYPSANRDEDAFETPDVLDLSRRPNNHLAFGFGPHFCLGASLARLELRVMFREVLTRLPDLVLAGDEDLPYRASNFITGPEAMPVRFAPHPTVGMSGPLEGVKVVELAVWVAGPGAGGILADWGADVVKLEPPTGDPARGFQQMLGGDIDVNPVFELDNRGKRSVVLDLSTDRGADLAQRLLAEADVFLTNIRPQALQRLGLGPDEVRERHPGLVYAIITGYGLDGPDAGEAAYDIAAYWARAGIAEALRVPGGPLPMQRGGMGDHTVAMTGAGMVSAALVQRARTGEGELVATSLLRQGAYTIGFDVNVALMWGTTLATGIREHMPPTVNNFTAGDGRAFWIVGLEGERHWPVLARVVGRPEWLDDERLADPGSRRQHHPELVAELDAVFATRPLHEWAEVFATEPDLFWAPVNTIGDLPADQQFLAAGGVVQVPDEEGGRPMLSTPADFGGQAPIPRWRAPSLGEHTREVLVELDLDEAAIEDLITSGVALPAS